MLRNALGLALVCSCALAQAQSEEAMARARTHFDAGKALYRLKNYSDAIREFSAGYELVPRPAFLVNLGQCYDKIADGTDDPDKKREALNRALEMYKQFLTDAPPNDPLREQALQVGAEIERKLAALPPPSLKAKPADVEPAAQPAPAAATQPAVVTTSEAPRKKSFVARHWWIFPVGAVVLAGVAVGIYFGVRPTGVDCSSVSLGCIDTSR